MKRCKFCGKETKGEAFAFCEWCYHEGFDDVYKVTGRSNGWDRKERGEKGKTSVRSGWRGQKVLGGGNPTNISIFDPVSDLGRPYVPSAVEEQKRKKSSAKKYGRKWSFK